MNEFVFIFNLFRNILIYFHFQDSKFTIDLFLITKSLTKRVFICQTRSDLNHDLNHMLVEITLDLSINLILSQKWYNWNRLNQIKFEKILKQQFLNIFENKFITIVFNNYIKILSQILTKTIQLSTFESIFFLITSDFNSKCQKIRVKSNQIRKIFQRATMREKNVKLIQQIWKTIRIKKKRIIQKILKTIHRNKVKKTIEDSLKI